MSAGAPSKEMGGPSPDRPRLDRKGRDQVIASATLLIKFVTLPPTACKETIAATEINAAINVYSMAVAPCSLFIKRRKMDSIWVSPKKKNVLSTLTGVLAHRPTVLGTNDATDPNAGTDMRP